MTENIVSTEESVTQNLVTSVISRAFFALDKAIPGDDETDYKSLYYGLYNGITTVLMNANTYKQIIAALKQLQCEAEDAYINQTKEYNCR